MAALGIGLIGTGYMGKCHAMAWNAVLPVFGDVEAPRLLHLAETSDERARQRASELGFEKATGDWRTFLDDPLVDVVSITTPNQFHAEMAIAALEAGKHVWCEKPMATALADAERMQEAAARSGKVAVLGYNYIQNPVIRHIRRLLSEGAIGEVNHVRIEMDEDFMADPTTPFSTRSALASGYGALDDFGVHPLSLLFTLFGHVESVVTDMVKPSEERPLSGGGARKVENHDVASVLMRMESGTSVVLMVNRAAWGRKGRIALQVFGSTGSILYDQERMNEFEIYQANGPTENQGFRKVLAGPYHQPYDRFVPAPGHSLGFNDLKVIECRELIAAIGGKPANLIDFKDGLRIERSVHAMAQSFADRGWVRVEA
ncbi:Gfo/Idh/MocA family oxidoreductase [Sinorhizobium sp. BG8]|uniref:Gfo/Idh/MocA family protein n=1 Tax=Sinorhizobium sp. BG8 TaxID=2613773 RepID=UPI00193E8E4B|nr:Gfo/Idh/MocA family oxidoreductase [Sinorhizobium sp. BG8]QRM57427.1 Gfo/Idh/MocA family oxidoreductase [Sinorhizobium sp. BG8]